MTTENSSIMGISELRENYIITIPTDIRMILNFNVGDEILYVSRNNKVYIKKKRESDDIRYCYTYRDQYNDYQENN